MSLTDVFTRYLYNTGSHRWLDAGSRRFVSKNNITGELDRLKAASIRTLEQMTRQLYSGAIDLQQWQLAVAAELKDAHLANAMFARGGKSAMNSQALGRVGGNLADEFRWLQQFAEGIAGGRVSEAQAIYRIGNYGRACEQAYTREWALQRRRPEWRSLPALNQVPRDGKTTCYGKCNCELVEHEDGIHWKLNPGESCDDCKSLAAGGPYQPGRV
ncbi:MAG: hypothetical protein JXB07_18945 [Anaerolineae bacterium]|nr:hypothetical protein [Anaerolineae bacterium]